MSEIIAAIVGAVVTALIALAVFAYRNKITFASTTIDNEVVIVDSEMIRPTADERKITVSVQRLTIRNRGYRSLSAIELHWPISRTPIAVSVSKTSALSSAAVSTRTEDDLLKIGIGTFPSGEEIDIDMLFTPYSEWRGKQLRGTGGPYKIIAEFEYQFGQQKTYLFLAVLVGSIWFLANVVTPVYQYVTRINEQPPAASISSTKH